MGRRISVKKSGFITVAALILMLASVGIVLAMVNRSSQGARLARNAKAGNQTLQDSNGIIENALKDIQKIDVGVETVSGFNATERIPENIQAATLCSKLDGGKPLNCYKFVGGVASLITATDTTTMLSEVAIIETKAINASRAIQATLPTRVLRPDAADVKLLAKINGAKIDLSWQKIGNPEPGVVIQKQIILRRAKISATQLSAFNADASEILHDTTLKWVDVVKQSSTPNAILNINTTSFTDDDTVPSGEYLYTLKVTNNTSPHLDSLYITPTHITRP